MTARHGCPSSYSRYRLGFFWTKRERRVWPGAPSVPGTQVLGPRAAPSQDPTSDAAAISFCAEAIADTFVGTAKR